MNCHEFIHIYIISQVILFVLYKLEYIYFKIQIYLIFTVTVLISEIEEVVVVVYVLLHTYIGQQINK